MAKRLQRKPARGRTLVGASPLLEEIARRGSDKEAIARRLISSRADVGVLLEGMKATPAAVKYGCEKVLRIVSERSPELVYPLFAQIVEFLDGDTRILKWGATVTLSNLVSVDVDNLFLPLFGRYFATIPGPDLVAAANTIGSAVKIARAKPELADRIAVEVLKVEKAHYKTAECRYVAIGHALAAFEDFWELITRKDAVRRFIRRQLGNPRRAVALRAAQFLKRTAAKESS